MRIPHVPFDLRLGRERGDRVHDDDIHRGRAHERIHDVERLFARIGLRDVQIVEIDAQLFGIHGIERMLGVHERRDAAQLLRFGDRVQRNRRLTRRFGTVDLDHSAAGESADAERKIQRKTPRRDDFDVGIAGALAELHDRALAVRLFDLGEDGVQRLEFFFVHTILLAFFTVIIESAHKRDLVRRSLSARGRARN